MRFFQKRYFFNCLKNYYYNAIPPLCLAFTFSNQKKIYMAGDDIEESQLDQYLDIEIDQKEFNNNEILVLGSQSSRELAKEVVSHLDIPLGRSQCKTDLNNEHHITIFDSVRGKHVFYIQSMNSPLHDNIMEMLLTISTLKRSNAKKITVIIPYFAYSREQRNSGNKNFTGTQNIGKMMEIMGADQIVTFNFNSSFMQGNFNIPLINIDSRKLTISPLINMKLNSPVIISTLNQRNVERAKIVHKELFKQGIQSEIGLSIPSQYLGVELQNRDCIIVENIIDSSQTMVNIANQLKKSGAKNIYVSSIHGIFSGNSGKIIKKSPINKIFVTNSYSDKEFWNQKIVHISIGKSVAKVIAKLHNNQSLENFRQNKNY